MERVGWTLIESETKPGKAGWRRRFLFGPIGVFLIKPKPEIRHTYERPD